MYCDTSKILIKPATKEIVYNIITKKHYSNKWTASTNIYAVYYRDGEHKFFGGDNLKLIGAVLYGHPVGFRVVKSISDILENDEVLELKRLWIEDGYGKNIESYHMLTGMRNIKVSYIEHPTGYTRDLILGEVMPLCTDIQVRANG